MEFGDNQLEPVNKPKAPELSADQLEQQIEILDKQVADLEALQQKVDARNPEINGMLRQRSLTEAKALVGGLGMEAIAFIFQEAFLHLKPFDPSGLFVACIASIYIGAGIWKAGRDYKINEAKATPDLYAAIDSYYKVALEAAGIKQDVTLFPTSEYIEELSQRALTGEITQRYLENVENLISNIDDRMHRRSIKPYIPSYIEGDEDYDESDRGLIPYDSNRNVRENNNNSWLTKSKFNTEHNTPVESLNPERLTNLAEKIERIIYADYPVLKSPIIDDADVKIWGHIALPPYDKVDGEQGRLLDIVLKDQNQGFTIYYVNNTVDGSDAKVGLWVMDKNLDKKMWIVLSKNNGVWEYIGADIETTLRDKRDEGVWNTEESNPEEIEAFFKIFENAIKVADEKIKEAPKKAS